MHVRQKGREGAHGDREGGREGDREREIKRRLSNWHYYTAQTDAISN